MMQHATETLGDYLTNTVMPPETEVTPLRVDGIKLRFVDSDTVGVRFPTDMPLDEIEAQIRAHLWADARNEWHIARDSVKDAEDVGYSWCCAERRLARTGGAS